MLSAAGDEVEFTWYDRDVLEAGLAALVTDRRASRLRQRPSVDTSRPDSKREPFFRPE